MWIELSANPDLEAARLEDASKFAAVERGQLYGFSGTSVLGISFVTGDAGGVRLIDDVPVSGHGTVVAGVAKRTAPDIVVVAVEAVVRSCTPGDGLESERCVVHPDVIEAMSWISAQPWIDVISLSFATPGNYPTPEFDELAVLARAAVESGKLVIAGAGNNPSPALVSGSNGPPWTLNVGGVQASTEGAAILAAAAPDVVANYTAAHPSPYDRTSSGTRSGTSLAAPRVAGVLAKALAEVRREWGHAGGITPEGALAVSPMGERATPWTFRDALNASARHWNATDWEPAVPQSEDPVVVAARSTIPVLAPAQQMGWGFVDNATAAEIARRVLEGDLALPAEKQGPTQAWMEAVYAAREAYWAQRVA